MANPEQGSAPQEIVEKRLVFDEERGKWRMKSTGGNRGGHPRGQPISPAHAQKRDEGLKQYWQELLKGGNSLLYQQHTDKISEGVKSWWQRRK